MKSTALPRNLADWLDRHPTPKKRKRIPAMSQKRAKQMRVYRVLRKKFLLENPLCRGCETIFPTDPTPRPATDIHHSNSRIGEQLNNTADWIQLCRTCHTWCHSFPSEARALGLLA